MEASVKQQEEKSRSLELSKGRINGSQLVKLLP